MTRVAVSTSAPSTRLCRCGHTQVDHGCGSDREVECCFCNCVRFDVHISTSRRRATVCPKCQGRGYVRVDIGRPGALIGGPGSFAHIGCDCIWAQCDLCGYSYLREEEHRCE